LRKFFILRSPGEKGGGPIGCGDIMHTALQCAEPQLNSCFCVDPEMPRATRRRFLETFADSPVMVIPAHFPTPSAGWIRSHDALFRFHFDYQFGVG
jgi:predicted glycosyltransferase